MGTSGSRAASIVASIASPAASVMTTAVPTGLPLRRCRTNEAMDDAEGGSTAANSQSRAEGVPFDRAELDALLDLAAAGCGELTRLQQEALAR